MPRSKFRKFWTAAATHWSQEERAASHVERQGFEFYLPRFSSVGVDRRGRKFDKRELLFPGYLMIRVAEGWERLVHTRGVKSLFMMDEFPRRMRDEDVESIRIREDDRGLVRLRPAIVAGQRVRVDSGIYAGLDGIVQSTPALERCLVLFHMLGRSVTREFDERVLSATA